MKALSRIWLLIVAAASLTAFGNQTPAASREAVGRIPTEPDVILEWNAAITGQFEEPTSASSLHVQARVYAMAHLAMRDAVASAAREVRRDSSGSVARIAASVAAHDVLVALRPAGGKRFAALEAQHLAAIANDGAAAHGRKIGRRIAASILSSRAADGWPVMLSRSTAEQAAIDSMRGTHPTPFVLKRVHQFEPEPPFFAYTNGMVLPNDRLQSRKLIGTPADLALDARAVETWRNDYVRRWNHVAHSLAGQQPQDLPARAQLFASLNLALADALLAGTYWSDAYHNGRMELTIHMAGANDAFHRPFQIGVGSSDPTRLWSVNTRLPGFPAIAAATAGAAEAVLRSSFGGEGLRTAARQCAWSANTEGTSSFEGCVAGYDLGSRIAKHVLKHDRR